MARPAIATKKKWEGVCQVCQQVHPLILAMQDPEVTRGIEDGTIIPVPGEFMVDIHDFEGKPCPGAVDMPPRTATEVHPSGTVMGVCCSCQKSHPVQERDDVQDTEPPYAAHRWAMKSHNFPGTAIRCEGEGIVPQAVFVK